MDRNLIQVTKELNISFTRIVAFLTNKGFSIENKPIAKVSDEMYELLAKEFTTNQVQKFKEDRKIVTNPPSKYLGVLTKVQEKQHIQPNNGNRGNANTYIQAWVLSPDLDENTYFHSGYSLKKTSDIEYIFENTLVFYNFHVRQYQKGNRQDAKNVTITDVEVEIERDFLNYDMKTISFIFYYANDKLTTKLLSKIEESKSKTNDANLLDKIKQINTEILKKNEEVEEEIKNETVVNNFENSFLESIFKANTVEFNQNLFKILVEGLKRIDNNEIFKQAKFLLDFNNNNPHADFNNLNSIFYQKATNDYKFNFWFEGLIDFCDTDILKDKFFKADDALKSEIIKRCEGSENGFLVLNNDVKKSDEIEEVYFRESGICDKLLEELDKAQESICVAVAWFTNHVLFDMLHAKLQQKVKVELIIINDFINNWEFGLPFQKFIDSDGKLYFSEHPNIMHHKFCIIDNQTLFNGSYNWTYFAEKNNDENIMLFKGKPELIKQFNGEFNRLKGKLGAEIKIIKPFENSDITRFERIAFREYLSTDLELKAKAIRKTNIIYSSKLVSKAFELNTENKTAEQFQKEISAKVELKEDTIKSQISVSEIVKQIRSEVIEQVEEDNRIVLDYNNDQIIHKIEEPKLNTLETDSLNEKKSIPTIIKTEIPIAIPKYEPIVNIIQGKIAQPTIKPATQTFSNGTPPVVRQSQPMQQQKQMPIIIPPSASIPKLEDDKYLYENLQLVFALDYSNSMEIYAEGGHKLYSSGKIQKVINKIFAISKALTSQQNIEFLLFEVKALRLPKIVDNNYLNFVETEILGKHKMNGTDIFSAIEDIHKKYIIEDKNIKNIFVILVTDGENNTDESNQKIKDYFQKHSNLPIFWQFVGLGSNFSFLESLDKIASNVAFFNLNDIQEISNDNLRERLLQQFPKWYEDANTKGIIK